MTPPADSHCVRVELGDRSYDAFVGDGVLGHAGAALAAMKDVSSWIIVTNAEVRGIWGEALEKSLDASPAGRLPRTVVEIPDGEQHKTLATLERIYDAVLASGADRSAVVVALGGGIVGDVAGFAAATILRGVRLAMIPTTLLAQVDSSVGGKTAVNRPQGKNLVGVFHQPSLVLADIATLGTLPEREYRAGLAEVIKYGVILDRELFELLEARAEEVAARDAAVMGDVVARCVQIKSDVVARDETEGGLRRVLNFGHTVGHAVEKVTGYNRFLHGEAVAMGMGAAMRLSAGKGLSTAADTDRVVALLQRYGLEAFPPSDLDPDELVQAVKFDKKASGAGVHFILAEGIGRCSQQLIPQADVRQAL